VLTPSASQSEQSLCSADRVTAARRMPRSQASKRFGQLRTRLFHVVSLAKQRVNRAISGADEYTFRVMGRAMPVVPFSSLHGAHGTLAEQGTDSCNETGALDRSDVRLEDTLLFSDAMYVSDLGLGVQVTGSTWLVAWSPVYGGRQDSSAFPLAHGVWLAVQKGGQLTYREEFDACATQAIDTGLVDHQGRSRRVQKRVKPGQDPDQGMRRKVQSCCAQAGSASAARFPKIPDRTNAAGVII
jgi:hypothetical protein